MYSVEVHKTISIIVKVFYGAGIWHRLEETPFRLSKTQWFYLVFYLFYPISLLVGSITNDNTDEAIFSLQVSIITTLCTVRLYYLVSKQKEIVRIINQVGAYSIGDFDDFNQASEKLNKFMKFVNFFICYMNFGNIAATFLTPLMGSERKLLPNIAFPLDWKNNTISYIITKTYISIQILLTTVGIVYSIIIWYLLFICASQYAELGNKLKNLGAKRDVREPRTQRTFFVEQNLYLENLISAIKSHRQLNELTEELRSFISLTVLLHVITSSLSICGSIFCLAFIVTNEMEYMVHLVILIYTFFDIFMIMYFGNEIKVYSDQLCYCLFQSNWIHQTELTKKCIIIFAELLKQPKELVIAKLYRLTLETFTKILNSAYFTFNILKTLY